MLQALEWNAHQTNIFLTISALQQHALVGAVHIKKFKGLEHIFLNPDNIDPISSHNSTHN